MLVFADESPNRVAEAPASTKNARGESQHPSFILMQKASQLDIYQCSHLLLPMKQCKTLYQMLPGPISIARKQLEIGFALAYASSHAPLLLPIASIASYTASENPEEFMSRPGLYQELPSPVQLGSGCPSSAKCHRHTVMYTEPYTCSTVICSEPHTCRVFTDDCLRNHKTACFIQYLLTTFYTCTQISCCS